MLQSIIENKQVRAPLPYLRALHDSHQRIRTRWKKVPTQRNRNPIHIASCVGLLPPPAVAFPQLCADGLLGRTPTHIPAATTRASPPQRGCRFLLRLLLCAGGGRYFLPRCGRLSRSHGRSCFCRRSVRGDGGWTSRAAPRGIRFAGADIAGAAEILLPIQDVPRTSTTSQYALDVNVERVEDMVTHQRLLEEARYLQHRLSLEVGVVQIAEILSKLQIKEGAKRDCDVGWLQNKKVYNVLQQQ
ncbi:uncharacterized protein [Lolium perenne]|uniref:uncharacterized protein n=1 Tax=Lolium perenne TaxID=4522 RepID=UPI0021F52C62|nr:uncharacterized protein LOC127347070 [Lolium perenne]